MRVHPPKANKRSSLSTSTIHVASSSNFSSLPPMPKLKQKRLAFLSQRKCSTWKHTTLWVPKGLSQHGRIMQLNFTVGFCKYKYYQKRYFYDLQSYPCMNIVLISKNWNGPETVFMWPCSLSLSTVGSDNFISTDASSFLQVRLV